MIEILIFLSEDPEPAIAEQARASIEAFPDDAIKPLLASAFSSESIFEYFSRPPIRSTDLMEALILNRVVPDVLITRLADQFPATLIEVTLINVMRLLRVPEILEALERNPHNTPDTNRRLGEIRFEFFEKRNTFVPVTPYSGLESSGDAGSQSAASTDEEEPVEPHPISTDDPPEVVVAAITKLMELDGEEVEPERVTTLQKIAWMTVAERVQLAIKGSRDERLLLIRDSNKMVARAVLHSPKISENEVESISQMRNVNEEVLRLVGSSRVWAKNYIISHNLVRNPRAPIGVTLQLLNRLMPRDIKALSRNRNIPEVIRKSAHRLVTLRGL